MSLDARIAEAVKKAKDKESAIAKEEEQRQSKAKQVFLDACKYLADVVKSAGVTSIKVPTDVELFPICRFVVSDIPCHVLTDSEAIHLYVADTVVKSFANDAFDKTALESALLEFVVQHVIDNAIDVTPPKSV